MKRFLYILTVAFVLNTVAYAQQSPVNRVVIGGEYFYVHTVQSGETFFSLTRKYNVTQEDIVKNNPTMKEGLRAGETIKIPAPQPEPLPKNIRNRTTSNRKVEVHIVNQGETAYSIAKRYAVSVDQLIDSNPGLDPTKISIGQRILIPREAIGSSTQTEVEAGFAQYTDVLNEVSEDWGYHLVEKGETLYSLTRQLGVLEEVIRKHNANELVGGLKAGSMLKYPVEKTETPKKPLEQAPEPDSMKNSEWEQPVVYDDRDSKRFDTSKPLEVALMMSFTHNGREETSSIDYYNGTLLALQDLKTMGMSVNLSVYDLKRSGQETRDVLKNAKLKEANLIVADPRSNGIFKDIADFGYRRRIPVVSPQALVDTKNPFVFQVRPAPEFKYDKLRPFLTTEHNVVLITPSSGADKDFLAEIERLLPVGVKRISYEKSTSAHVIQQALARDGQNIVIVPTESENITDEILAKISTIQNTLSSRTGHGYPVQVVGSPQWARFRNNDKELFFKLQAMYVTLYYADRTEASVASFDQRYLSAFGTLPSLFSYRGYDVAKLFVSSIERYGTRYASSINRLNDGLLQVPYHFRKDDDGKWINDEWVLVRYQSDYIINVR